MPTSTINPRLPSSPIPIGAGTVVTVTPSAGGSANVEYTNGTMSDIVNGVALWLGWPAGVVRSTAYDCARDSGFIRVSAFDAPCVVEVDGSPVDMKLRQIRSDWYGRTATGSARGNRKGVFGDSLTAFGGFGTGAACVANGCSITVNHPNHAMTVGQSFIAHQSAPSDSAYHGIYKVVAVIDKDNFIYATNTPPTILSSTVQFCLPRTTTVEAWWAWANQLNGSPFDIVVNAGIGSNITAQMRARLETDVIAYRLDFCTLMAGTNDIRSALTDALRMPAAEAAFDNIKAMCLRMIETGVTPILCTVLPVRAAHVSFTSVTAAILYLNNKIRAFALNTPGIILADTFQAIVDPALTTNAAKDAWLVDDVHLNGPGAFRVGRVVAKATAKYAPNPQPLVASNGDVDVAGTNRMPNPWMISSGGRLNGTLGSGLVAQYFSASKAGDAGMVLTPSLVDRTVAADGDTNGKNQVLQITSVADNDSVTFARDTALTAYTAGDVGFTDFVIKFKNAVNLKHCQITYTVNVNGSNHQVYVWAGTAKGFPNEDFTATIRTRDFIMPSDSGNIALSIQPTFGGPGGAEITISQLRIGKRVTA